MVVSFHLSLNGQEIWIPENTVLLASCLRFVKYFAKILTLCYFVSFIICLVNSAAGQKLRVRGEASSFSAQGRGVGGELC